MRAPRTESTNPPITNERMTNGRRGMGCWLWVTGYEGMRSVRRATHAPGAATSVAVRSEEAHGQWLAPFGRRGEPRRYRTHARRASPLLTSDLRPLTSAFLLPSTPIGAGWVVGYGLRVMRECGRCGGPPMLPGRRLQSPCAAKRRMGSGLLPSDGGEGTAAPGFARGLAPRIDPAAKRKPPPGGRGPGTRMESQRDSVPQPGVAAARRYPGKSAPPHPPNPNGVVSNRGMIAGISRGGKTNVYPDTTPLGLMELAVSPDPR